MSVPINKATWSDRTKVKQSLFNWLEANDSSFLLSVKDKQELENISNWAEKELSTYLISLSFLSTDATASCYNMMKGIVEDIGWDNFPRFQEKYDQLSKTDPTLVINQRIATDIQAKSTVEVDGNRNILNLKDFNLNAALDAHLENKANEFLADMIEDLKDISEDILFIIRFIGNEMSEISSSFSIWFENHFLRKIARVDNVRVLLLFQGDPLSIKEKVNPEFQFWLQDLTLSDIQADAPSYFDDASHVDDFCLDIVNASDQIGYADYRMRLLRKYKRSQIQSS